MTKFETLALPQLISLRTQFFNVLDVTIRAEDLNKLTGKVSTLTMNIKRSEYNWDTSSVNGTIVNKLLSI